MTHLKTNELHQKLPLQYNYAAQEEHISLVDLWILIRRYKKHFIFVFTIVFFIGLPFLYFTYEETYSLVSTIQIGTREKDNAILPIEAPESLLSKISSSIIPFYTNTWIQKHDVRTVIETMAFNPKKSDVILITNKTTSENIPSLSEFQKGLVKTIVDDHKSTIHSLKSKVESELRLAQVELNDLINPLTLELNLKSAQIELDVEEIELKKLEDERFFGIQKAELQADILKARHEKKRLDDLEKGRLEQYKRVEESKKMLLEKISELEVQISDAKKNLRAAATGATEQSAMTQLLIANEIQQTQNQLAEFEDRYYVGLENEKMDLMQEIEGIRLEKIEVLRKIDLLDDKYNALLEDNKMMRDQQRHKVDEAKVKLEQIQLEHNTATEVQKEKVREIKTRLDNFNETRAVSTAVQSLKPSGVSRVQLILMAFVVAGIVAFAAVLFAIFGDKVKERLEEEAAV